MAINWYQSYKGRYALADNMDDHIGMVEARQPYENKELCFALVVLKGSINLKLNNSNITLHSGDYISIMPHVTIELLASRGLFFTQSVKAYEMAKLYQLCDFPLPMSKRAYCYRLYHFGRAVTEEFRQIYLKQKEEIKKSDYPGKQQILNELYVQHLVTIMNMWKYDSEDNGPVELEQSNSQKILDHFINLLSQHFDTQREVKFYAHEIGISSRYLSVLANKIFGQSASAIIDNYVVFRIKLLLMQNEYTIKQVSQMLHFGNQSFFGRYFHRITGFSPRQYINNEKTEADAHTMSRQYWQYRQFLLLIDQYCRSEREVKFYAFRMGITSKYLSAICGEYTNKTASRIIETAVLQQIDHLMAEHKYSIKEISQIMNFPSQSFFGRYFKRLTGMSPLQYAKENS